MTGAEIEIGGPYWPPHPVYLEEADDLTIDLGEGEPDWSRAREQLEDLQEAIQVQLAFSRSPEEGEAAYQALQERWGLTLEVPSVPETAMAAG